MTPDATLTMLTACRWTRETFWRHSADTITRTMRWCSVEVGQARHEGGRGGALPCHDNNLRATAVRACRRVSLLRSGERILAADRLGASQPLPTSHPPPNLPTAHPSPFATPSLYTRQVHIDSIRRSVVCDIFTIKSHGCDRSFISTYYK